MFDVIPSKIFGRGLDCPMANLLVNTDHLQAALAGSLRRRAAPAAGYLERYA